MPDGGRGDGETRLRWHACSFLGVGSRQLFGFLELPLRADLCGRFPGSSDRLLIGTFKITGLHKTSGHQLAHVGPDYLEMRMLRVGRERCEAFQQLCCCSQL
jgi:hypothetical protein